MHVVGRDVGRVDFLYFLNNVSDVSGNRLRGAVTPFASPIERFDFIAFVMKYVDFFC